MSLRRLAATGGSVALLLSSLLGASATSAAGLPSSQNQSPSESQGATSKLGAGIFKPGLSTVPTTVNVRQVARAGTTTPTHPKLTIPRLRPTHAKAPTASAPVPRIVAPAPVEATSNGNPAIAPGPGYPFDGLTNLDSVEPPDPWIAAGPSELIQMTNFRVRITDRSGTNVMDLTEDSFFNTGATGGFAFGDGRIIYDSLHQRWLATELRLNCMLPTPTSYIDVARSNSSDPRGGWTIRSFPAPGAFLDYPGVGTSTDKIVLGFNLFSLGANNSTPTSCLGTGFGTFLGAGFITADWSAVLAGSPIFGCGVGGSTWANVRPAVQWPATDATIHGMLQIDNTIGGGTATDAAWFTLTGHVGSGSCTGMVFNGDFLTGVVQPFSTSVPDPLQPGPDFINGAVFPEPTDAIWQNGKLWWVSNYSCIPTLDPGPVARDCVRITKLNAAGIATPTVAEDFYLDEPGEYLFFGGIGVDGNGTLHISYTQSGASQSIIWRHVYQRSFDPINTVSDVADVAGGTDDYDFGRSRWGDYVGLAPDPTDSNAVWVSNEFATGTGDWTTQVDLAFVPNTVTRLYGPDRYTTGVAISDLVIPPGVANVFIASGLGFADALGGAAIAGQIHAPVLLVPGTSIPMVVDRELKRLRPVDIWVLGGPGSVSNAVQTALAGYVAGGAAHVHRVWGANRYATGAAIATAFITTPGHHVYVASGVNFPDALAGAPLAALNHGPVLLVTKTTIPAEVQTALTTLAPSDITIFGETGSVSDAVRSALAHYVGDDGTRVHRLGGANRYETAQKIVQNGWPEPGTGPLGAVFVAAATNFPDALGGSALAGITRQPILLVRPTSIPPETVTLLNDLDPAIIVVFGGTGSVTDAVKAQLQAYIVP